MCCHWGPVSLPRARTPSRQLELEALALRVHAVTSTSSAPPDVTLERGRPRRSGPITTRVCGAQVNSSTVERWWSTPSFPPLTRDSCAHNKRESRRRRAALFHLENKSSTQQLFRLTFLPGRSRPTCHDSILYQWGAPHSLRHGSISTVNLTGALDESTNRISWKVTEYIYSSTSLKFNVLELYLSISMLYCFLFSFFFTTLYCQSSYYTVFCKVLSNLI